MKKILCYCPSLYHHDKGMWPPTISSTSYFLWQWNLWSIFQELKGWKVLWNGGQPNSNLYDPISKWRSPVVKYTKMKIHDALKNCDIVLVDVPSTIMWDAKREGKPCLCLAFEKRWIREDVLEDWTIWIEFISRQEVKPFLEHVLKTKRIEFSPKDSEDLFVINRNDWLKEITG